MIIVGGQLNSGIGQHAYKYTKVFDGASYHFIGSALPEGEHGLLFLLPIKPHIDYIKYARTRIRNLAIMTVCETETVHEDYGLIMNETQRVAVPSEFCKRVKTGKDDYLFKKDMTWGDPDEDMLYAFMKDALDKNLRHMDHTHTKEIMSPKNIIKEIDLFMDNDHSGSKTQ